MLLVKAVGGPEVKNLGSIPKTPIPKSYRRVRCGAWSREDTVKTRIFSMMLSIIVRDYGIWYIL